MSGGPPSRPPVVMLVLGGRYAAGVAFDSGTPA